MKFRVKTQKEADELLVQMAREAGVGVSDICEIAIYNLIAVYLRDKGDETTPAAPGALPVPTVPAGSVHASRFV